MGWEYWGGEAFLAAFKKEIDRFIVETGKIISKILKIKAKPGRTSKENSKSFMGLGCLFWIIFPLAIFTFFYLYSKWF